MDSVNREILRHELQRDEGTKLKAYKDSLGIWTIGTGRNLDGVGILPAETAALHITTASARANGITMAQAEALLDSDIDRAMADLDRKLPWWRRLDPVRQRVMVNLCFMGIGNANHGLLSFVHTLADIQAGRYAQAAAGLLASRYAKQVGARATRLADLLTHGPRQL